MADDPSDNTYGHTPLHIQTGDGKRYIVLFAGHPVVIAGVGYRIDAIGEAHIDNALVDICDTAGILALDTALLQVVPVGVLGNTLDVSLDAQVLQTVAPHTENTDQNLIAYGKTLMGVTDPVPGKVTGKDGGFNAEDFHAHNLFGHCNHTRLDDAPLIDTVHTGSIRIQIENLAFAQHGLLAAGNYAAGLGVDTTHDEVNVSTEHVAKDLILAQHKVSVFLTGRAATQIDHHFLDRDNDTEPLVIHNCHRLAVVQLFNAAQLAGDDLAGAVGIMDFMPDYWKTAAVAKLLQSVCVLLWSLLLIIPGIIATYSYAMTEFILSEHPDLTASEAIAQSKEMMSGNRWRLFCLHFSFIGWDILSSLTLGIGNLWLRPYKQAANAAFYREISDTGYAAFDPSYS